MSELEFFIWLVFATVLISFGIWMDDRSERRRRQRMMATLTSEETVKLKRWFRGERWKGELYVIPTIRIGWGEFQSDPRLYWIGIYWLQWSIHIGLIEVRPRIW